MDLSRNAPCPCGSGKKYKRCCGLGSSPAVAGISPTMLANFFQQAAECLNFGRYAEAETLCEQIMARAPGNPDAFYLAGLAARALGKTSEAVRLLQRATAIKPGEASFHCGLGIALNEAGKKAAAIAALEQALRRRPQYAEANNNLGFIYLDDKQYKLAEQYFRRALVADPRMAEAHYNLGCALAKQERDTEAEAAYRQAIAINPRYFDAWNNLGLVLRKLGLFDEAIACFTHARAIAEANHSASGQPAWAQHEAITCWNESLCHLLLGDFAAGLPLYEAGWPSGRRKPLKQFAVPLWTGNEPLPERTIFLHAEQGLGDTLQFVRYAKVLADKGARVILEVQPALKRLLQGFPGTIEVLALNDPAPAFDYYCPLLSLPLACGTRLETIPHAVTPRVDTALRNGWRQRLGGSAHPRIGLVWAGNPEFEDDATRSFSLSVMAPLLERLRGLPVQLIGLQKKLRAGDLEQLKDLSMVHNIGPDLADLADTAAVIDALDLVISVDTSVAHLAATLGKPTWVLLSAVPDWRWLLKREDSPWYPSVRLFRQMHAGDWQTLLLDRLLPELEQFISVSRPSVAPAGAGEDPSAATRLGC